MKNVIFLILALLLSGLFPLISGEESEPGRFLNYFIENSDLYRAIEWTNQQNYHDYRADLSVIKPQVEIKAPGSLSHIIEEQTSEGYTLRGQSTVSAGLTASVTQLLPTAGTLSASLGDTLISIDSGEVEPDTPLYDTESELSHTIKAGFSLTQPLFTGKAYEASRLVIEEQYRQNRLQANSTRTQIILDFMTAYYELKQLRHSLSLVRSRLLGDRERLKKRKEELALGVITLSAFYQSEVEVMQSETELLELQQNSSIMEKRFRSLYFKDKPGPGFSDSVDELACPLSLLESGDFLKNNPSLQQLESIRDSQRAVMVLDARDRAPLLSLGTDYTFSSGLSDSDEYGHSVNGTLTFSYAFSDGGAFRNRERSSALKLKNMNAEVESESVKLLACFEKDKSVIRRSEKLKLMYEKMIEVAAYEYQRGEKDLEMGHITSRNLYDLRMETEQALQQRHNFIIEKNLLWLRLLASCGKDLSDPEFYKIYQRDM